MSCNNRQGKNTTAVKPVLRLTQSGEEAGRKNTSD